MGTRSLYQAELKIYFHSLKHQKTYNSFHLSFSLSEQSLSKHQRAAKER